MKARHLKISFPGMVFFLAVCSFSSSVSAEISKGPYLQNPGLDRITVMWETDSAPESRVEYGVTEAYGSFTEGTSFSSNCGRVLHEVPLEGLESGTRYYYRVRSGAFQSSGYTLRTAPPADTPFTFAVYGDNRSSWHGSTTLHEVVVQSISGHTSPDIVVNVGDVVETGGYCGESGFRGWGPEYFHPGQPLFGHVPQYVSIGNHEYTDGGDPAYFQDYFSFPGNDSPSNRDLWYSFDYGNAHFTVLNSNYYQVGGDYSPGSEQYRWLTVDLQDNNSTWKFVAFHHPPYVRAHWFNQMARDYLVPLFERYGVQAVFNGHIHFYERSRKRGIYYLVSGGGGASLSPVGEAGLNPYSIYAASLLHHCRVKIDGSRMSFWALETGGTAFDSFEMDLEEDDDGDGYLNGDEYSSAWDPADPYSPAPAAVVSGDYRGDGSSLLALFRPPAGLWAIKGLTRFYFGLEGDIPSSGDYDGDGSSEVAVFRLASGLWAVRGWSRFYFGLPGDLAVPGDYDGDGTGAAGIFRPSTGLWAVRGFSRFYLGGSGDFPAPADYNGDGTVEGAVFRMRDGSWRVKSWSNFYFGRPGDLPRPGDYDGDGTATAAIFRGSLGLWAVRGVSRHYLGGYGDSPVNGDFDGDARADFAVFRPSSGLWAMEGVTRTYFGSSSDIPVTR